MQQGPNGTALFAEISSHIQYHKKLIALINILTIDVLPSWYLMAEYSDGSGKIFVFISNKSHKGQDASQQRW